MMILAPLIQKYNTKWIDENVKVQVNQDLQDKFTQYINFIHSYITYVSFQLIFGTIHFFLFSGVYSKINALIIVQIHERLNLLNEKY